MVRATALAPEPIARAIDRKSQLEVMSDARNKAIMRHAFQETAKGNGRHFVEGVIR
jgi:hypothetical protein